MDDNLVVNPVLAPPRFRCVTMKASLLMCVPVGLLTACIRVATPTPEGELSGEWLASWGQEEPYQSLLLTPTTDRSGLQGLDEWLLVTAYLAPVPPNKAGYNALFYVMNLSRRCPGAQRFPNAEAVPDSLPLDEAFPIVFYGLGERGRANDGRRVFSGLGVKIDVCGVDKAYQAFRLVTGKVGAWAVLERS